MTKIKAENQKAIDKLKTAKPGKAAADIVCDVRNAKARLINRALAKLQIH